MSRQIKFRVRGNDGGLIGYNRFEAGRWQCQMLKSAGGSEEWSSGVLHGSTIEQYTGLRDSKGMDIYESDVVEINAPEAAKPHHYEVVEWQEADPDRVGGGWATSKSSGWSLTSEVEVVGNIHENRDLLSSEGDG
jgi:uncharacterized phage protein (TIGR01671 family)